MRALIVCGLLMAAPLGAAATSGSKMQSRPLPEGPKIRVLLEKDIPSALLEVRGGYQVIRRDSGAFLSSGTVGKRFVVHAISDGIRWGEEYPDVYQISILPTSPNTLVSINGIQYKGAISVFHVRDNKIAIVNEVPIEEYLKSTLTIKYEEDLHPEALSAMAIAARTEAYARVLQRNVSNRPWEITAKEAEYFGRGVTHRHNGIEDAVDGTRFVVLESPTQKVDLAPSKADELANLGLDARKILQASFPNQTLGITINSDEVALR